MIKKKSSKEGMVSWNAFLEDFFLIICKEF